MALVSGRSGFGSWFQFLPKTRGWSVFPSFDNDPYGKLHRAIFWSRA